MKGGVGGEAGGARGLSGPGQGTGSRTCVGDLDAEREGGGPSPAGKLRKQLWHPVVNTGRGIRTGFTPGWVTCSLAVWPRVSHSTSLIPVSFSTALGTSCCLSGMCVVRNTIELNLKKIWKLV